MNKPALSLALAGTLSLAALAGCGSSSTASKLSTSVSSITSTASPSSTDAASQSPTDTTSASPTPSSSPSTSTSATSTASASSSATSASPSASISLKPIPRTAEGWRINVPFGWGGATQKKDGSTYHLWTPSKTATANLLLITGQLNKGETFSDDLKDAAKNFGMSAGTDINTPVSVPGADGAQELAGLSVSGSRQQYLDLIMAHKGRDVVIAAATATTKAAMTSSGLHQNVRSLARA